MKTHGLPLYPCKGCPIVVTVACEARAPPGTTTAAVAKRRIRSGRTELCSLFEPSLHPQIVISIAWAGVSCRC